MIGAAIITTFLNLIAYLIVILILQHLCFAHMNLSNKNLIICTIVATVAMLGTQLLDMETICNYVIYIMYFGTILALSSKRLIDLLLSILAFLLYMALSVIPLCIIEYLFPGLNITLNLSGVEYQAAGLIMDIVTLIILLGIQYITCKYTYRPHLSAKEVLFSIILPFLSLMICGMLHLTIGDSLLVTLIWQTSLTLLFIASYTYYFYLLIDSRARGYREITARTQTAYLKTQLDSLQNLKEKEKDVQKMRHDLKNHISVIESLCAQGNYTEVLSYTSKLGSSYFTENQPISGNKIADTILHTKTKSAKDAGINFTFEGGLSALDALSEPDICGLLANAYDNAIEACLTQEHAYIHTKANTTRNHTYIEIRNSIPKKIKIHSNQLKTTKEDKYNHGYGIEIMKQIARKYHGSCEITSTDTEFIVEITLLTTTK